MKCKDCKQWCAKDVNGYGICIETEYKDTEFSEETLEYQCNKFVLK